MAGASVYAGAGGGTFRFPVFVGPAALACGAALTGTTSSSCDFGHVSTTLHRTAEAPAQEINLTVKLPRESEVRLHLVWGSAWIENSPTVLHVQANLQSSLADTVNLSIAGYEDKAGVALYRNSAVLIVGALQQC